jgi:hypothetical protein
MPTPSTSAEPRTSFENGTVETVRTARIVLLEYVLESGEPLHPDVPGEFAVRSGELLSFLDALDRVTRRGRSE